MADQSLQAFQLGASLFDRAQTQARMMEQMQMQAAEQVMRQRQYDLQNKIQSNAYAQALAEQEAQAAEFDTFQKFNEDIANYLNDPELKAAMPALPRFKSKTFNQNAIQAYQGLQQYSPRAKILKAREEYNKIRADNIAEMQRQGIEIFDPQTGEINEQVYQQNLPTIKELMKEKQTLTGLSQDIREEVALLDKTIPLEQRIKTARASIEQRKAGQIPAAEKTNMRLAERAVKEYEELFGKPDPQTANIIESNALSKSWKFPDGNAEKRISGDETIARKSGELVKRLDDFEKNYGPQAIQKYVGIIDGRVTDIKKRLSGAKTQEEKDAYALLQRFQDEFNQVAFERSGKAVTTTEMQRLVAALGNIKSSSFADDVRNFASMSAEDLYGTIRSFKEQYRIRPEQVKLANELVDRFKLPLTPFGQQQPQAAQTGTAAPAPSLPAGFSTPQTNQVSLPAGWGFKQ